MHIQADEGVASPRIQQDLSTQDLRTTIVPTEKESSETTQPQN